MRGARRWWGCREAHPAPPANRILAHVKHLLRLPLLLLFVLAIPLLSACEEADTGWTIEKFDVVIEPQQGGDLKVTESLLVNFNDLERHGIFRDIPENFEWTADDSKVRRIMITNVAVTDFEGNSIPDLTTSDGTAHIRIGNASQLVTGRQAYRITYTARVAMNAFSDHDEIYWNVTGNEWTVPILEASATIRSAVPISRVTCFQGPTGSTESCPVAQVSGNEAQFQGGREYAPGEGLTVVAAMPAGSFDIEAPRLADRVYEPKDLVSWWPFFAVAGLIGFFPPAVLLWLFYRKQGRDAPAGVHGDVVVVEYEPPDGLRPAEIGLLMDESVGNVEISATIVDMAARGYLDITQIETSGRKDYELTMLKPLDNDLEDYEQELLVALFTTGSVKGISDVAKIITSVLSGGVAGLAEQLQANVGAKVKLSDLRNVFHKTNDRVKTSINERGTQRGWFRGDPKRRRNIGIIGGIVGLSVFGGLAIAGWAIGLGAVTSSLWGARILIVGASLVSGMAVGSLLWLVFARALPARSATGRELTRRAKGFRQFIEVADKSRQEFYEKQGIFERYLPYAIVFGAVDKWAKTFEVLGIQVQEPAYFHGVYAAGMFNAASFGDSMNSFSSSTASVVASTPGGSGGSGFSGGGGSSGGGGGGGGGGSW